MLGLKKTFDDNSSGTLSKFLSRFQLVSLLLTIISGQVLSLRDSPHINFSTCLLYVGYININNHMLQQAIVSGGEYPSEYFKILSPAHKQYVHAYTKFKVVTE